jgi:hypothetical protein
MLNVLTLEDSCLPSSQEKCCYEGMQRALHMLSRHSWIAQMEACSYPLFKADDFSHER